MSDQWPPIEGSNNSSAGGFGSAIFIIVGIVVSFILLGVIW